MYVIGPKELINKVSKVVILPVYKILDYKFYVMVYLYGNLKNRIASGISVLNSVLCTPEFIVYIISSTIVPKQISPELTGNVVKKVKYKF